MNIMRNGKQARMGQRSPKEPRERSGKVMSIMRNGKQARMGQRSPKEGTK